MMLSIATSAGFVWSLGRKTTPYIGLADVRELSTSPALPDGNYKVLEESTIICFRLRVIVKCSLGSETIYLAEFPEQALVRREENICRFCRKKLPDWKQKMTPEDVTPSRTAVMAVVLNGEEHRITVEPGRSGRKHFEREIRRLFNLSQDDELEFTFDCQTPGNGGCSLYNLVQSGKLEMEVPKAGIK